MQRLSMIRTVLLSYFTSLVVQAHEQGHPDYLGEMMQISNKTFIWAYPEGATSPFLAEMPSGWQFPTSPSKPTLTISHIYPETESIEYGATTTVTTSNRQEASTDETSTTTATLIAVVTTFMDMSSTITVHKSHPAATKDSTSILASEDGPSTVVNEDTTPKVVNEDTTPTVVNEITTPTVANEITTPTVATTSPTSLPTNAEFMGNYDLVGCYKGLEQPGGMDSPPGVFTDRYPRSVRTVDITLEKCEFFCLDERYFAVGEGTTCVCGRYLVAGAGKVGSEQCNIPCPGPSNSTHIYACGGEDLRFNVYERRRNLPTRRTSTYTYSSETSAFTGRLSGGSRMANAFELGWLAVMILITMLFV